MESDLSQYHHIDYRDRWRFDAEGHRRLTLRMVFVRVRNLPPESQTALAQGGAGWRIEHYLAAHLYTAISGNQHPAYPARSEIADPAREKRRREAIMRKRERERAIASGDIT
ncbi:MAG: hypothetical protein ACOH10_08005 [Rhodoglobus sp.]